MTQRTTTTLPLHNHGCVSRGATVARCGRSTFREIVLFARSAQGMGYYLGRHSRPPSPFVFSCPAELDAPFFFGSFDFDFLPLSLVAALGSTDQE
jgi:hypothetical protein